MRSAEQEQRSSTGRSFEHAHAVLVEQPVKQPLGPDLGIEQFLVLDRSRPAPAVPARRRRLLPAAERSYRRRRRAGRAGACARRLRQELREQSAGPPVLMAAAVAGQDQLAHRQPDVGRNLLGLAEIGLRRLLQADAVERHDALIALRVLALVDGERQNAVAEQFAGSMPRPRDRRRQAVRIEAGIGAQRMRRREIGDEQVDRAVVLVCRMNFPSNFSDVPSSTVTRHASATSRATGSG